MTKSPEHIVLAVVLVLLAATAGWLAYSFPQASDIVGFTAPLPKGTSAKALKAEDLQESVAAWNSPDLWNEPQSSHRLFNSEDYMFFPAAYPSGDYIKKLDAGAISPSGVKLSWYKKYKIDIANARVDQLDADGDGFSNIVEYKNEKVGEKIKPSEVTDDRPTNPMDPNSHPDYLARLRLQKYESTPFGITFNSYTELNGVNQFQIHLEDIGSASQPGFKKTGDPLGYQGYTVGEFHKNIVKRKSASTGIEQEYDESTLELTKPDIDLKITLPYRKKLDSPESTANFAMLMPDTVDKIIKVPRGKILVVPHMPDVQFLVLDVTPDTVKIRDVKTKKEFVIPKLDPAEWDEVPQAATPSNAPKTP